MTDDLIELRKRSADLAEKATAASIELALGAHINRNRLVLMMQVSRLDIAATIPPFCDDVPKIADELVYVTYVSSLGKAAKVVFPQKYLINYTITANPEHKQVR